MKEKNMKNTQKLVDEMEDDLRPEYDLDFSDSMPNKYAAKLNSQELLRQLEPDVRKIFDTPEKVNNALRAIIQAYPKKKKKVKELV